MTIAAGFCIRDGLLLCADTRYTGMMKIDQTKLFPIKFKGGNAVLALAGNEGYGKMAINDAEEAIQKSNCGSVQSVLMAIRRSTKVVYEEYVDKRPPAEIDAARFELLAAIQHDKGDLALFANQSTAWIRINNFHCVGSGAYLSHYLITNAYDPNLSIRDALVIAIQVLRAAKAHDASCGGRSEFIVLTRDGLTSPVANYEVSKTEEYIGDYEVTCQSFLLALANVTTTPAEFEDDVRSLIRSVRLIRAEWEKGRRDFDTLFAVLAQEIAEIDASTTTNRGDRKSTKRDLSPQPPSLE